MRLWRRFQVWAGILKLYSIDYGGETDWVSAYNCDAALAYWRQLQRDSAGQDWLDELDAEGDLSIGREWRLETVMGGDAYPGMTFRMAMTEFPAPSFVATTLF